MSTATQSPTSATLFTRQVTSGARSFFFDVKKAPRGELFLTISELSSRGGVWTRSRVLVPAHEARAFYLGLCETIKAMREVDPTIGQSAACQAEGDARPTAIPVRSEGASSSQRATEPKKSASSKGGIPPRATGRASQGANRQALLA